MNINESTGLKTSERADKTGRETEQTYREGENTEPTVIAPDEISQTIETTETSEKTEQETKNQFQEGIDNRPAVNGVTEEMQKAAFWINLYKNPDEMILNEDEIKQYNINNFIKLPFLTELGKMPKVISGSEVIKYINQLSIPSQSARYDENRKKYQSTDYVILTENLNIAQISESLQLQFGLTVRRTLMRTWPTYKEAYQDPDNMRNDMFVETAVYPAEPIAVYHTSKDGQWYFARIYNYAAWIPAADVALCSRNELEEYLSSKEQLVIKGALIHTLVSIDDRISGLQLDMGVSLPVQHKDAKGYTVNFPVSNDRGALEYAQIKLAVSESVQIGNIDYNAGNVIRQAFKFLGESYGWGGMNNARDCSSFILDIYRSFGVKLPRNTDQQEQVHGAISLRGKSRQERHATLEALQPGSALYIPGHTMMYLGKWQDRHYIIHDAATVYEKNGDGSLKPIVLYQVAVTPIDVCTSKGVEYLMALTTAVEIK